MIRLCSEWKFYTKKKKFRFSSRTSFSIMIPIWYLNEWTSPSPPINRTVNFVYVVGEKITGVFAADQCAMCLIVFTCKESAKYFVWVCVQFNFIEFVFSFQLQKYIRPISFSDSLFFGVFLSCSCNCQFKIYWNN